jgi:hypothetical protein
VLIITPTPACLRCCLQSSMSTPYRSPAHQATSSVSAFRSEFRARGQTRPLELLLPMRKGIFTARSILCPASGARQSFSRFFPGVRSCHLMTRPSESTERHENGNRTPTTPTCQHANASSKTRCTSTLPH